MSGQRTAADVPPAPPANRPVGALVAGATGLAAAGVAVLILAATGELAAADPDLFDPGALVRYGLPVARAVSDLAAALGVGSLVLAAWLVAPDSSGESSARSVLLGAAGLAIRVWLVLALAVLVLTVASVLGMSPQSPGFLQTALSFTLQTDLGRAMGVSILLVTLLAGSVTPALSTTGAMWAAAIAVGAVLPLALGGHAAGSADHMNSVDSLALHLIGATVWTGGLAALLWAARSLGPQLPTVARRYSVLAGWCFVVVAGSGVVNAALRLESPRNLASTYGVLVLAKTTGLVLLGIAGWRHRTVTLSRLDRGQPRAFLRLAAGELVLMGVTFGLAVALSRSATPTGDGAAEDPQTQLLGYPAPPPLTLGRYLTAFYPELLWLVVAAVALGGYLWGVARLRRREVRWPLARTVFWTLGCLALVYVTSGGPAVYGRLSFSAHMLQHMALMTVVPMLLVFGAPVTLALRAVPARTDGSTGLRETLLGMVHSRLLRTLGNPIVAATLLTGSLVLFYYTRLFELAMFTHVGHVAMTAHFLLSGYLFVWSLVGLDPGPARPAYPLRLLLLLITLSFHAFFGISLMQSGTVLAPQWWAALGQTDTAALLTDQQTGGAIAWASGDLPSLFLGIALLVGWVHSDAAESRRRDRQADRDSDAELRRYNERLAAMARRDQRR